MNQPSKKIIAAAFNKKVGTYQAYALFQQECIAKTVAIMINGSPEKERWLDAGAGIGLLGATLPANHYPHTMVSLDIARASLTNSKDLSSVKIQGDIDMTPFRNASFDGIVLNAALQWSHAPHECIKEIARVLKPMGRLIFTIFTQNQLRELNSLRKHSSPGNPVHLFSEEALREVLHGAGFIDSNYTIIERIKVFPDALSAFKQIRQIGATAHAGEPLKLTDLRELAERYTAAYPAPQGGVLVTESAFVGYSFKRN